MLPGLRQLFDADWYRGRSPDVGSARIRRPANYLIALAHYLTVGARRGRNPHPLFDTRWYSAHNPSARWSNPLLHYLTVGASEGLDPHPLFDTDWYLAKYRRLVGGSNPLAHYIGHGAELGCDPNPLFDTSWYQSQNPDVAAARINPLSHYLSVGAKEGGDPHPLFDTDWYLAEYAHLVGDSNPLAHYIWHGVESGCDPNPLFDTDWYLATYGEDVPVGMNPLAHYMTRGAQAGFDPSPAFSSMSYLVKYPDVAASDVNPLVNYLQHGRAEGRVAYPRTGAVRSPERTKGETPESAAWSSSGATLPSIAVMTLVYHGSDIAAFEEAAESVRHQTRRPAEWIVLVNGEVPSKLSDIVRSYEREGLLSRLTARANVGILAGLKTCLEAAEASFILTLDADDALTPDAIEELSKAAARHKEARIFYADEDLLVRGIPCWPFFRPDFDPVLAFSHSYILHPILFDRALALELGLFSCQDAEFAQDWDTVLRFILAGHRPVHIPEVLYHWRRHAKSVSNTHLRREPGSARALFSKIARAAGMADLLEPAKYPIETVNELYLKRRPERAPATLLVALDPTKESSSVIPDMGSYKPAESVSVRLNPRSIFGDLERALEQSSADLVILARPDIRLSDPDAIWNGVRHLELLPEVAAVGGCITDSSGEVLFGAPVSVGGSLVDPLVGRRWDDPGEYSLPIKAHAVDVPNVDFAIFRRTHLLKALHDRPPAIDWTGFGAWLGYALRKEGLLVAFEPLMRGITADTRRFGPALEQMKSAWSGLNEGDDPPVETMRGLAGFCRHALAGSD